MNFTAIDFETANRKRSSACSIGMAKVREGQIISTYYELLSPGMGGFEAFNIALHGITPQMVEGRMTLLEIWDEIERFIDGDVLVAHNVNFEESVIKQTFSEKGLSVPNLQYLCTQKFSMFLYPERANHKLNELYQDIFGVDITDYHNALNDARACAEIAIHGMNKHGEKDPLSVIKTLSGYYFPATTPILSNNATKKPSEKIVPLVEVDQNHVLFGKNIVITGELSSMDKTTAAQLIVNCGATFQKNVSRKTDYLVLGNQDLQISTYGKKSNKLILAEDYISEGLPIQIIDEAGLLELIGTV